MSNVIPPVKKRRVSLARAPLRQSNAIVKGQDAGRFTDFYHGVLTANWAMFLLQLAVLFVAVNLIFTALYMLDPTGVITSWNIGGQRIKGYSPEEIIGQHFSCFYTEVDRANEKPARALRIAMAWCLQTERNHAAAESSRTASPRSR